VPIRHDDANFGPVGVEFVGENSGQRGRGALAELGRRRHDGDRPIGGDGEPEVRLERRIGLRSRGRKRIDTDGEYERQTRGA